MRVNWNAYREMRLSIGYVYVRAFFFHIYTASSEYAVGILEYVIANHICNRVFKKCDTKGAWVGQGTLARVGYFFL